MRAKSYRYWPLFFCSFSLIFANAANATHINTVPSKNFTFSYYFAIKEYPQSNKIIIRPDTFENRLIGNISYESLHPELIRYKNTTGGTYFFDKGDTYDISSSDNLTKINITSFSSDHFIFLDKISKMQNISQTNASLYSYRSYKTRKAFA